MISEYVVARLDGSQES